MNSLIGHNIVPMHKAQRGHCCNALRRSSGLRSFVADQVLVLSFYPPLIVALASKSRSAASYALKFRHSRWVWTLHSSVLSQSSGETLKSWAKRWAFRRTASKYPAEIAKPQPGFASHSETIVISVLRPAALQAFRERAASLNQPWGFSGQRIPLKNLFNYLGSSSSLEESLEDFPTVSCERAVAVLVAAYERLCADASAA